MVSAGRPRVGWRNEGSPQVNSTGIREQLGGGCGVLGKCALKICRPTAYPVVCPQVLVYLARVSGK